MPRASALGLVCLASIIVGLTGCGGKIQYPHYYELKVPAAPAALATQTKPAMGSVSVREFSAPSFLRAGAIVYRESPEEIKFYQYHRWAVDPRTAVTNAVVQELQARGLFESVARFDGRERSDYLITGRLDELEEIDNGRDVRVQVRISAQLMNIKTGEVVWKGSSAETSGLEHRTMTGLVDQMSQAMQVSVERLVSSMEKKAEVLSASAVNRDIGQE